jgi:hypothetical protein
MKSVRSLTLSLFFEQELVNTWLSGPPRVTANVPINTILEQRVEHEEDPQSLDQDLALMAARGKCFILAGSSVCSWCFHPQQSHFRHTMILDRPVGVTIFSTLLKYPRSRSFSCRRMEMALPVPMEANRM